MLKDLSCSCKTTAAALATDNDDSAIRQQTMCFSVYNSHFDIVCYVTQKIEQRLNSRITDANGSSNLLFANQVAKVTASME